VISAHNNQAADAAASLVKIVDSDTNLLVTEIILAVNSQCAKRRQRQSDPVDFAQGYYRPRIWTRACLLSAGVISGKGPVMRHCGP
jgi:hypothetical protein